LTNSRRFPKGTIAKTYDRVTLKVTLEQAEILSVYADTGSLRLVARRPDDVLEVKTSGASPSWHKRLAGLTGEAPEETKPAVANLPISSPQPSVRSRFKQTIINNGQVRVYEYDAEDTR
jgi:Flp pilus assembly protein CpaB